MLRIAASARLPATLAWKGARLSSQVAVSEASPTPPPAATAAAVPPTMPEEERRMPAACQSEASPAPVPSGGPAPPRVVRELDFAEGGIVRPPVEKPKFQPQRIGTNLHYGQEMQLGITPEGIAKLHSERREATARPYGFIILFFTGWGAYIYSWFAATRFAMNINGTHTHQDVMDLRAARRQRATGDN
eukprot:TRINITY_DN58228_c0_g1_i1.p1 TRINITY_DN58228_c0_g1~~TRINITY_DN58228_c0_g1_i1.p1  ORF type:complete len:189 (+),score=29.62 TRINITY_DN58228_c0_g1_i1:97-663(+)